MKKYTLLVLLSSLLLTSCGNEEKQNPKNVVPVIDEEMGEAINFETANYYLAKAMFNLYSATGLTRTNEDLTTKEWAELYYMGAISFCALSESWQGHEIRSESISIHENGYSYQNLDKADYINEYGVKYSENYSSFEAVLVENVTSEGEGGTFDLNEYEYEADLYISAGECDCTTITYSNQEELDAKTSLIKEQASAFISDTCNSIEWYSSCAFDMGEYYRYYLYSFNDYYYLDNPTYEYGEPHSKEYVSYLDENYAYFDIIEKDNDYFITNKSSVTNTYVLEDLDGNLLKEQVLLQTSILSYTFDSYEINPKCESEILEKCKKHSALPVLVVLDDSFARLDVFHSYFDITNSYNVVYPKNQYDVYALSLDYFKNSYLVFALAEDFNNGDIVIDQFEYVDNVYGEGYLELAEYEDSFAIHVLDNEPFSLLFFVDSETNDLVKVQVTSYSEDFPLIELY